MKSVLIAVFFLCIGIIIGILMSGMSKDGQKEVTQISNFEECVAAGYAVMESYPARCQTPEGNTFTQEIQRGQPGVGERVACTMEVKSCPDGSSVGRSGPNCEFAPCPDEK